MTLQDIRDFLDSIGYSPDNDPYFGITLSDHGDGTYGAFNNPATTDFRDLNATLANLQRFDVDGDRSIFTCFV